MSDNTETETLRCPVCGAEVPKKRFCNECGAPLPGGVPVPQSGAVPGVSPAPKAESDPEIPTEMLADYCRKTCGTPGFDGYDELVLGRREDGTLQLDEYHKKGSAPETHRLHLATEGADEIIARYIRENDLLSCENAKGLPLCGGDFVVKFRKEDGTYCRLTSANAPVRVLRGFGAVMEGLKKE